MIILWAAAAGERAQKKPPGPTPAGSLDEGVVDEESIKLALGQHVYFVPAGGAAGSGHSAGGGRGTTTSLTART